MSLRDRCFRFYWGAQKVIAPGLRYAQDIYERALFECAPAGGAWLDLGCGHQLLPAWRAESEVALAKLPARLVGLDADRQALSKHRTIGDRVAGSVSRLPFADETFDLVTANMVLEHLPEPQAQLREVWRVLRPNGAFLVHTPNRYGYSTLAARLIPERGKASLIQFLQGRPDEDVYPTYYRANSQRQLEALSAGTGFSSVDVRYLVSDAQTIMIPPFVVFELLWIRLLMTPWLRRLRTNLIATFVKGGAVPTTAGVARERSA